MKNTFIKLHESTIYFLLIAMLSGYIKYALIILFIVIFHELGHVFIVRLLGFKIENITIYPFGGYLHIEKHLNDYILNDFLISIFGIIFQVIILLLCKLSIFTDPFLYKANIEIMLFNFLPIIPLDGSKILFEFLCIFMPYKRVLKVYPIISFIGIILFILMFYNSNFNILIITSLFIYKTIEFYKNINIYFHKFILERILYDLKFKKIDNMKVVYNYKKDTKYYYYLNDNLVDEKDYLLKYFK